MAEVLIEFEDEFTAPDGRVYEAKVCGRKRTDNLWEGWIEFVPRDAQEVVRTGRETTQPNRADLEYWASGLTWGYLDGALLRTLTPSKPLRVRKPTASTPTYDAPAESRWRRKASPADR